MEFVTIIIKSANKNRILIKTMIKRVCCTEKAAASREWCETGASTDSRRSLWSFFSEGQRLVGSDGIPRYREHISAVICPYHVTGG